MKEIEFNEVEGLSTFSINSKANIFLKKEFAHFSYWFLSLTSGEKN
ncbi:hypothetical protein PZE06_08585 [Robertmurraya sp. DFI.2.37]|nr:hypothetical protein [Robertmurraya sp. DFI.2.37]MDF1508241.1 hypothetical protein [Robertmurraya sp. DFI.2.37]